MNLSPRTTEVLKNFAGINQGLSIKPGNTLRTSSPVKTIVARADVPDEFPRAFAIYDLNAFLSTLSLFEDPNIDFKEDHLLISSGKSKIRYHYSSPAVVVSPPDNDLEFAGAYRTFHLPESDLKQILKASAVLRLTHLNISDGSIRAVGANDNKHHVEIAVDGEGTGPMIGIKIENIKIIPGSYDITVAERAVTFQSSDDPSLRYNVIIEATR